MVLLWPLENRVKNRNLNDLNLFFTRKSRKIVAHCQIWKNILHILFWDTRYCALFLYKYFLTVTTVSRRGKIDP